jgi:CBS domain-containing protein
MIVASILQHKGRDIAAVAPTARVPEIVRTLAERRIGAVLIRDTAGQMLGIVSERDIVRGMARDGVAVMEMSAAQLMTSDLHTVTPGASVADAMKRMTESRVRHLPVLDHDELVGLISIGDVVLARLEEQAEEVDNLKAYVAGSM